MCLTPNCPALPIPNDYVSPEGMCVCGDVICGSWESCDPATGTCIPICPAALPADTKCLCGKETCQAGEKCDYETAKCTRKS
ncbi:hypothetical protein AAVH_39098 [Aphelenchoides avenae]|nr:hypothetical protein AAVH_39098 [Aphelenchus avenae]